jgi:hypothetical protein
MAVFKNIETLSTSSTIGAYTQVVRIGAAGITLTLPSVTNNSFIGYGHKILITDYNNLLGGASIANIEVVPNGSDTGFTVQGDSSLTLSGEGIGYFFEYAGDGRWIVSQGTSDGWIINPGKYRVITAADDGTSTLFTRKGYAHTDLIMSRTNSLGDPKGQLIQGVPNNVFSSSSSPTETGSTREGRLVFQEDYSINNYTYWMPLKFDNISGATTDRSIWIDIDSGDTVVTLDVRMVIVNTSDIGAGPYNVRHSRFNVFGYATSTSFTVVGNPLQYNYINNLSDITVSFPNNGSDNKLIIRFSNSGADSYRALGSYRILMSQGH